MKEKSFEPVAHWYDKIVGEEGHHYHQQVIMPTLLKLFNFSKSPKVLDLACGNGFLANYLPKETYYEGIDNSPTLLAKAKKAFPHKFSQMDLSKPFSIEKKDFTHATCILALQNIGSPEIVLESTKNHLSPGGKLFLVLNHPCFRIPRQSHWGFDEASQTQYRRIDRYMTPLDIPIHFKENSQVTSYHKPISFYINALSNAGFATTHMEELCSQNMSQGKRAKAENRSRNEIPLFLVIVASSLEY